VNKFRYKLIVEYDGTDFSGWQIQPEKRTAQGLLQNAISVFTGENVKLIGAGRTDAGVHATGQVCSFTAINYIKPSELHYRLNRMLPKDLAVARIVLAHDDFNPQMDAVSRTYRYYISERPDPLLRRLRYEYNRRLNLKMLNTAAALFIGNHDFSAFCKKKSLKSSNCCEIYSSGWFRYGRSLIYEITANRFLHHMIRRMVGAMLAFEGLKIDLTHLKAFINNKADVRFSVPAKGLILTKIKYRRE
jgi:tRNA pseudouridine38-40 synthase